jgi:hypothetical protein
MDDGANAPLTPLPPHSGTGFSASVHECVRILGRAALGRNEQVVMVVKIASLSKARMALMHQACYYDGVISLGVGWDEVR